MHHRRAPRRLTFLLANALLLSLATVMAPSPAAANPVCPCSIWNDGTIPGTPSWIDYEPPPSVELGVRFRAERAGVITSLRFYKGVDNIGTHEGSLWTSTGTLLSTVTFTNETATGWQQMDLLEAVPVEANTVYVASYFAPHGGYARDLGYFATSGFTNSPLTALGGGGEEYNGVYEYGFIPTFPNNTYEASNYWVDVVFQDTLTSIAVTPADTTLAPGQSQQFNATGTYFDNSTADLTSSVTWATSNAGVASVDPGGLATANAPGSTTISATLGSVSGSGSLAVNPWPLTVTANSTTKVYGQPNPAFAAAYSGFVNGDTPASLGGTLTFATSATATSGVGSYPVTPQGLTSSSYAIAYVAGTLSVTKAGSTTVLSSSPSPSQFAQTVTLTAAVAPTPAGAGTATGTVTFKEGTTTLGTANLSGGQAQLTISSLTVGSHPITANYPGDANVNASSGAKTHVVNKASTSLVASRTRSVTSVTFKATLTRVSGGTPLPGKAVVFKLSSGTTLCTATTNASGVASCTYTAVIVGSTTFSANFAGDANYLASSGSAAL